MDPTMLAIMGVLGGLGSSGSGGGFFGSKGKVQQATLQTPEQQAQFNQLLQSLGGLQPEMFQYLSDILSNDPEAMAKFEAPYKQQFQQETVPQIAEQFAGLGSGGSLSSSGLQNSLAQAGKELSTNLAALRGNLQQGAVSQLQGLMGTAYQPTFENLYKQPQTGFLGGAAKGAGQGLSYKMILDSLGVK